MSATVPRQDPAVFAAAESAGQRRERCAAVHRLLIEQHPTPRYELDHRNAFELLVATLLAARAKDTVVNERTPQIFERWPDPAAMATADPEDIKPIIKGLMNYNRKADSLVKMAQQLVERHGGDVPADADALAKLPGVGRKTALTVLGGAMGIAAGIAVDTHVNRVSSRLAFAVTDDTDETERALCELVPQDHWVGFTQRMVLHGRYVCVNSDPHCDRCVIAPHCPSRSTV